MRKVILLFLGLVCVSGFVWAQSTSKGTVVDTRDGSPLPGVTVTVKNTKNATVTGPDGSFSIAVPANGTLQFSSVGYQLLESKPALTLTIRLTPGENSLSEVVVTGYGSRIRREITGSIARVSSKDLANTPVTSFESAIQGRAAGVFVEQQNGKLGQGIKVRVRGSASVTAGSEPFYVIDGIPVITTNLSGNGAPTSPLADINPNDIESIEILKDASAAAIYGSRASNGVVLITTKKGKAGKSKIEFGYFTGTQKPTHLASFMNAEEYVNFFRQAVIGQARQDVKLGRYPTLQAALDARNTSLETNLKNFSAGTTDYQTYAINNDWQSRAFQEAPMSQYDLNLSGGNEKTTFYMGGQYLDQKGIILRNALKRYSGRINLENKVSNWLSVGINMSFARSLNKRISNDNQFSTPLQIVALPPVTPATDPRTGLTSGALDPATGLPNATFPLYYNPMLSNEGAKYTTTVNRTLGNVFGNIAITKGLTFRTELGMDQLNQTEESYNGRVTRRNNSGATYGTGYNSADQILNINTNNYFRYNTVFASAHKLEATGGMSYQNYKIQSNSVSARDFPSDAFVKLASAATNTAYSTSESQYSFIGYFARANYTYNEKYIVAVSGRYDASSRFGKNNRWGFFPAASVGWIASDEKFLSDISWLNFLKLKMGYGLTGNAEIGNFASRGLFSGDASYGGNPGIRATQIPNPDLKWETTVSTDFGVEATILKNRITVEADYYVRKTKDLLLNVDVPGTSGFSTQLRNLGKLQNKGIELTLNTNNLVGKFRWTTSLNYAANRNKITNLGGQLIGTLNVAKEGEALGVFFTREFAGADPANGDALYYKNTVGADGKPDRSTTNSYNAAQNVVVGNPNPDFIYGFRNTFSYSGLELDVFLQGVYGNEIFAAGGQYFSASGSNGYDNQTKDQLKAWKNPGDITMVPEARIGYPNGVNNSSRYIYDGSYLRVKALTLSYILPTKIASKLKLERARFYVRGQNLFTITTYPLWDPEVNADYSATNIVQGRDFYSVPQAKTIVFGLNIGL